MQHSAAAQETCSRDGVMARLDSRFEIAEYTLEAPLGLLATGCSRLPQASQPQRQAPQRAINARRHDPREEMELAANSCH